ncbi:MAG TPA: substrate-binding domain-containing protein [Polyangiaceae bacterium]|nr:substrate-binding domain-containing protein [Polyangiaceae bacterium]
MPAINSSPGGRQRTRVALLMRNLGYSYQDSLLQGVHESCQELGYDTICLIGGVLCASDPRNSAYSVIGEGDVDAVIFASGTLGGGEDSPQVQATFARFAGLPRCNISYAQAGVPSICVDNASGVYASTRHLIEKHGRRRLAFLSGPGEESRQRRNGFERAHLDCGLAVDPSWILEGDFSCESGMAAVARLGTPDAPAIDALVAANDWMAMGVLEEAERRGFAIPEQIALIGFDDSDQARFTTPALTTVRQPIAELGRAAVRLITAQLAGEGVPELGYLQTELVVRHSCGCLGHALSPDPTTAKTQAHLLELLGSHRASCQAALVNSMPGLDAVAEFQDQLGWSGELIDALLQDLGSDGGAFVGVLERLLHYSARLGNAKSWHGALSALRGAAIRSGATDISEWFRFESLIERAHIVIGSHAERLQGRRRIENDVQMHALEALGNTVRTALDYDALSRGLAPHLGSLGLERCWVTLTGEKVDARSVSRLVVPCNEQGDTARGPLEFTTGLVLPTQQMLARPTTYVVLPMIFGNETLGFCILPHGGGEPGSYHQICAPIAATVKAVSLLRTVVTEVTRREAVERERLAQEMAIAQRIQTAIFPKDLRVPGLEVSAAMIPATEVGGDYFDVLPTAEGCWLGIGDVVGHGLPTGLVALMIQSIVAAAAQRGATASPVELWCDVNSVLFDNVRTRLGQNEHATLTLMRYWTDGRVLMAGAHEDLILLRTCAESSEMIQTPGVWAGITKELSPEAMIQYELQLDPGDLLLLYSDGVTEAMNQDLQMFGVERLRRVFEAHRQKSAYAIREAIMSEVSNWTRSRDDDVTVAVLRYRG